MIFLQEPICRLEIFEKLHPKWQQKVSQHRPPFCSLQQHIGYKSCLQAKHWQTTHTMCEHEKDTAPTTYIYVNVYVYVYAYVYGVRHTHQEISIYIRAYVRGTRIGREIDRGWHVRHCAAQRRKLMFYRLSFRRRPFRGCVRRIMAYLPTTTSVWAERLFGNGGQNSNGAFWIWKRSKMTDQFQPDSLKML